VVAYLLVWSVAAGQKTALRETLGSPMPWYSISPYTEFLARTSRVEFRVSDSKLVSGSRGAFYLLLPVIVRVLPRQYSLAAAVVLALGPPLVAPPVLALRTFLGHSSLHLDFSRADALMVGVICAVLLRDPGGRRF